MPPRTRGRAQGAAVELLGRLIPVDMAYAADMAVAEAIVDSPPPVNYL